MVCGLLDGAALDRGDAGGHADHDPWACGKTPSVNLVDEIAKHLLCDVEIGDDTVSQRPNRLDVRRGPPDHSLGSHPYFERSVVVGIDGDHRRLVEDDPLPADKHQRVRGAEVNRHVATREGQDVVHGIYHPGAS